MRINPRRSQREADRGRDSSKNQYKKGRATHEETTMRV